MPAIDRPKRKPGLLLGIIILLAMGFASLLLTLVNAATGRGTPEIATSTQDAGIAFVASDAADERPSPSGLSEWIYKLGDGFDGKLGIAVHSLEEAWTAAYRGASDDETPVIEQTGSKWEEYCDSDEADHPRYDI